MKTFMYTMEKKRDSVFLTLYRIKKNTPCYVTCESFKTSAWRGERGKVGAMMSDAGVKMGEKVNLVIV